MTRVIAMIRAAMFVPMLMVLTARGDEPNTDIVSGAVVYDGQPYPEPHAANLPIGMVRDESLLVNPTNGGIANVVVSLTSRAPAGSGSPKQKVVNIEAKDVGFSPRVVTLLPSDTLRIVNTGKFATTVNIRSDRNTPLNQVLESADESTFTPLRQERWPLPLTCNIKPWMKAWVVVSASPNVAVSDERGRFQFHNVAPGEYDVTIWHERIGAVKDRDLGNPNFRRTTNGYRLKLENRFGNLGSISLGASQFDND